MSACFMFAAAPQPKLTPHRRTAIKELIHQFNFQFMLDVAEEYCVLEETDDPATIREELYQTVVKVCELDGGESSAIRLVGMDWKGVITGGLSHGDVPTEVFDTIATIGHFPDLEDLLRHFAQEDHKNVGS